MPETERANEEILLEEKKHLEEKLKSMVEAERLGEFGTTEDIDEGWRLEARIKQIEKQLRPNIEN